MDPNETLRELFEFLEQLSWGNADARAEAVERLRALASWLERGGFPPDTTPFTKGGTT